MRLDQIPGDQNATFISLWRTQQDQQQEFRDNLLVPEGSIDTRTQTLAMQAVEELVELLRATGYKYHRISKPGSEYEAQLEWADVFKFLLMIAIERKWDPQKLMEAFRIKTIVADSHMREKIFEKLGGRWIIFDIDDVLADYTGYMSEQLGLQTGNLMSQCITNTRSLGEQWGIDRREWELFKEQMRSKGHFAKFKPIAPAISAVNLAMSKGFKVLLLTNRPVDQYPRLYSDTILWLFRHNVRYHSIIHGPSKVHAICRSNLDIADRVVVAFDDHPQNIKEYQDIGIKSVLVRARENGGTGIHVDKLCGIIEQLGL